VKSIWIIIDSSLSDGADRELNHWLSEAGIALDACHRYLLEDESKFIGDLNVDKPPFIICLSTPKSGSPAICKLCPVVIDKRTHTGAVTKYRGSLLCSPDIPWPHYVVPAFAPSYVFSAWDERQNAVLCLAKVAEEYQWWASHSHELQPLPQRQLIDSPSANDCIDYLRGVLSSDESTIVSVDIENIGVYSGKYKTKQRNRIPYVIGFATNPLCGISVELGGFETEKQRTIWSLIDTILRTRRQVGQNYYTHDLPWLRYIGFGVAIERVDDTLVRHHALWPELSHKLDYQTFQYTREPYYKDEGKNWTVKEKAKMKRYNVKDVCVTLEIYRRQEEEFHARQKN
jgi:hypothetical protein